jgi:hypothetical protein
MTYIELRRSCRQESLILSQLPKQESQCLQGMGSTLKQYATFCTLEWGHFYGSLCCAMPHPREGVLLPGSIFGRCCTKFA